MCEHIDSGGPAAADVVAVAARLVASTADRSRAEWDEAPGVRAQALALARRALMLGERDALDYARARAELDGRDGTRTWELGQALRRAADAPLALAATAADVSELACLVASRGAAEAQADAASAAMLAAGAASAAAHLVEVNLVAGADEALVGVARAHARRAGVAAAMEEAGGPARPVGERA